MKKLLLVCFLAAQSLSMQAQAVIANDDMGHHPAGFVPYDFNQARIARNENTHLRREYEKIRRNVSYQRERIRRLFEPELQQQNRLLNRELNSTKNLQ